MSLLRSFLAQLVRLALIVVAILVGRFVLVRMPMVDDLQQIPGLGISAATLLTAGAYGAILALFVGFARDIEITVAGDGSGFPWPSLAAQAMVLAGIVAAYPALDGFARSLLGRHDWAYPAGMLLLACVPLYRMGSVVYEHVSRLLQRWEE